MPSKPMEAFDPQRVFGELVRLLRLLDPSLETAKVVYVGGGGKGVLPVPLEAVSGSLLSPTDAKLRDRIVTVLRESDVALNRKQVAKKLGLKDARGRFGRVFSVMERVPDTYGVYVRDGEMTDDKGKFTDDVTDDEDGE